MQHPCLGFHWGGAGFCQIHLQFCQNRGGTLVSLTRAGIWRWLLAAWEAREAGCASGEPHPTVPGLGQRKALSLGPAVLLPAQVEPSPMACVPQHCHRGLSGVTILFPAQPPQSPGGGWHLRVSDECPQGSLNSLSWNHCQMTSSCPPCPWTEGWSWMYRTAPACLG